MFEEMTYENILKSTLSRVSSDVDKRQGSIIYDAIAPACAELAQAYIQMDVILENSFADTAIREYLVLRAKERGIEPYEATRAVLKGVFNCDIPIGSRFSLNGLFYTTIEKISDYEYKMGCETYGTEGNTQFGKLLPFETINGLETAQLTELLIPGEDAEETEAFRKRYFESISNEAFGGNKADYINWVKAIDGVGQVKVIRTPQGGGTVGIIVTDSENNPASETLINVIKKQLDPTDGEGDGIAPIGHDVHISSVGIEDVDVSVEWELENDADEEVVNLLAIEVISEYVKEVNSQWENKTALRLYAAQILARLLDINGIVNIVGVKLNNNDNYVTNYNDELFGFVTFNGQVV